MNLDKKNSLFTGANYLSTIVISLVTLKININYFGKDLFGMWILFSSLWGIGFTFDFGFGLSIVKYIAAANHEKDYKKISSISSSSIMLFLLMGLFLVSIGVIAGYLFFFSNPQLVPQKYFQVGLYTFIILGINFYLQYIAISIRSIIEGLNNYVLVSKINILANFIILFSAIAVQLFKLSLVYLAISYCLSTVFFLIITGIILYNKYSQIKIKFNLFSIKEIVNLLKFSLSVQATFIFSAFLDPVIKYLIGTLTSLEMVTHFEIARKISLAISGLFTSSFRTALPKVSVLKNNEEYNNYLMNDGKKISRYGILYSGFIYGVCSLFIALVIKYWFGIEESIIIFLILSLPESLNNFFYLPFLFMIGIGKSHILMICTVANLLFVIVGLYIGFHISSSPVGVLGYYFSVLLTNGFLFFYMQKKQYFRIMSFMKVVKIRDLILVNSLLLSAIISISILGNHYIFYTLTALSALTIAFLRKDFQHYFGYVFQIIMKKYICP